MRISPAPVSDLDRASPRRVRRVLFRRLHLPILAAASYLTLAPPILAQNKDIGAERETASMVQSIGEVEEVIVTAQRRVENIQDVPIAVTALPDTFIEQNDVRSLQDLNGAIPGFYATNSVNYGAAPLSIRGIGGANGGGNFFNDEPVAVYVDDVYISRLSFTTADLLDINSIEVLRGPQGTLYGRNSTAGALLVSTRRPTEEFEGYILASFAQHAEQRVSGALSGELSEHWQARLALGYSNQDGWADNTVGGSDLAGYEARTGRLSLRYQPNDSFRLDMIGEIQSRDAKPLTFAVANPVPGVPSSPFTRRSDFDDLVDNDAFALNDPNENETDSSSFTAHVNWDLDNLALDIIIAYRDYALDGSQDSDGTQFTLFNNNGAIDSEQWSQEIRLSSDNISNFNWVVGAYFLQEEASMSFEINNFQGLFGAGTSALFDANQDLSAWALFGDATWRLNDRFSILFGARFSDEDKDFRNMQVVNTIGNSIPLPIPFGPYAPGDVIPGGIVFVAPPTFIESESFDDFSPRVVFNYEFSEHARAYISFNRSFKSGGYNSFGLQPAFDNEEVDAYELGYKSELLDNRLHLNAAVFAYDYTNLQVRLPVPTGGVTIRNAGEADVSGCEVEVTYQVTGQLRLIANATFLDTELVEFQTQEVPEDLEFLIGSPIPLNEVNVAGNELTRAPEIQLFLGLDYDFSLGENYSGEFQMRYRYQDSVFFLETNQSTDTFAADGSGELDLRVVFRPIVGNWEIAVFGQNVSDERTVTQVTALGAFPNAALNEPSKWGLNLRYSL